MGVSSIVRRIIARLLDAESREPDPHFRDDYRIARLTVAFAARGRPEPHVLATYSVLGLHPNKIWPSIVARRKAQLGDSYAHFYDEHGQLKRDDFGPLLPPKKPPQSVGFPAGFGAEAEAVGKFWRVDDALERSSSSAKSERRGLLSSAPSKGALATTKPRRLDMATTQTEYRKQPQSTSKNGAVRLFDLTPLVENSDLPERIRQLLVAFLKAHPRAKYGTDLFRSVDKLCVEIGQVSSRRARVSRRCMFERIRIARDVLGVLEVKHKAHTWVEFDGEMTYRHSATYRINAEKLVPRMTVKEYDAQKKAQRRQKNGQPESKEQTANTQSIKGLKKVQEAYLYKQVPKLMEGATEIVDKGGMRVVLSPEDKRYRPPLDKDAAVRDACETAPMSLKPISFEAALQLDYGKFRPKGEPA